MTGEELIKKAVERCKLLRIPPTDSQIILAIRSWHDVTARPCDRCESSAVEMVVVKYSGANHLCGACANAVRENELEIDSIAAYTSGLQSGHPQDGPDWEAIKKHELEAESVAAFTPDMPESETSVLYGGCTHTPPHSIYEIRECETQGNSHES